MAAGGRRRLAVALAGWWLLLLGLAGPAAAITVGQDALAVLFRQLVVQDAIWPEQDLVVSGFVAQPARLAVPGDHWRYRLESRTSPSRLGRNQVVITVLAAGRACGRVRLSGDLRLYGEVVCAGRRLSRHQVLTKDDLRLVRRDITMLGSGLVRDPARAVGKQLKTSLQPGAVLYRRLLANPLLVHRGDLVTIMARSGRVRVTVSGQVRQGGGLGELVRVKNLMSRKVVFARVVSAELVETEF